jgi:hypothetical protein
MKMPALSQNTNLSTSSSLRSANQNLDLIKKTSEKSAFKTFSPPRRHRVIRISPRAAGV